MWKFIQRMNIEFLRKQVAETKNEEERARLARRLAEEEARRLKGSEKRDLEVPPFH